jgi:hypothetical protein
MSQSELTVRAKGINYRVRMIQEKEKESKGSLSSMFFGINSQVERRGRIESLTSLDGKINSENEKNQKGTFYSRWEENSGEDFSFHILRLQTEKALIEIEEYVNYCGCGEIFGTLKTRNHRYKKWEGKRLENISIHSEYK